ncbi:hypothetical protein BDY24DRAFT_419523 [Mrakia frigida]|uniref:SET domain-containing protein n=1 Tax=Mrakia frigida TaxID=29902 RepID=UPI003FCC245C
MNLPELVVGFSNIAGLGLFAKEPIKPGQILGAYTGKVLEGEEAAKARARVEDPEKEFYLMTDHDGRIIDPTRSKSNIVKYANHRCTPNAFADETYSSNRRDAKYFIIYRALIRIESGEEITTDYCLDDDNPLQCLCMSDWCRGSLQKTSDQPYWENLLPPDVQQKQTEK